MATVYPVSSINDAITKAQLLGIDTSDFLKNVSYIEQNPTPYIYNNMVNQNIQLSRKIIDLHTENATEDKKSYYQAELNYNVEYYYNFLFYSYYAILAVFMITVWVHVTQNWILLILIAVILFFFPFWIIYVERYLLILYRFFAALIFGKPFSLPRQLYVFQTPDGTNIRF